MQDVTLTLSKKNLPKARRIASAIGCSLSELVDRLLVAEMSSKQSIARQHGRRMLEVAGK